MKNIIKNIAALLAVGSLSSCIAYQDGQAANSGYYDPYYNSGVYYAPSSYYGGGGYYGNDGYYYRNDMNYYYDNGIPYYVGRNNTRIYIVKQSNAANGGNSNTARFRNNGSAVNSSANSSVRTQNSSVRGFRTPAANTPARQQNQSLRNTNTNRTPAAAAPRTSNERSFRNTTPQAAPSAPAAGGLRAEPQINRDGTRGSR